jgi:hypothetical protein
MVLRKGTLRIASFDTTFYEDKMLRFFGRFDTVDIRAMLGASYFSDIDIDGKISGHINTSDTGFPLTFKCSMPFVTINRWSFDSLVVVGALRSEGIEIEKLTLKESHLVSLMCKGYLPWRFLGDDVGDRDTLRASMELGGDILAFLQKNIVSPIGGHGIGKAKFAFWGVPGDWHFSEGTVSIPEGVLTVKPFVLDDIKDFSFKMSVDSAATVTTDIRGTIRRRPVRIFSNHQIPAGYDPFIIGPLDFGMLQVETLKRGIHIHLPGFMPVGELGDIEFAGAKPLAEGVIYFASLKKQPPC